MKDIFPLLAVSSLTVITEKYGNHPYQFVSKITEDQVFDTILTLEKDRQTPSVLLLDGAVSDGIDDKELLDLLLRGAVRFFVAVDYGENSVTLLINEKSYDGLPEKLKHLP